MSEDRRQLVLDALRQRPVHRVPVGFWRHYYSVPAPLQFIQSRMRGPSKVPPKVIWKILPNNPFKGYESDRIMAANLEGHKRDYLALQPDFVKIMSDGFFSHPAIVEGEVSSGADLGTIKHIDADHPWITRQVDLVKELLALYDGEIMAFYNVFAPIQQFRLFVEYIIKDVAGFQDLLVHHAEAMAHAAEIIAEDTITLLERLKDETGIDGMFYSVQSAQRPECDRAHHDKYIKPSDLRVLTRINELWEHNILHICGYEHYQNDLEYYATYPAAAYNWAVHTEGVSLAEGRKIFHGALLGGFDNNAGSLIDIGSTHEVVEFTQELITEAGPQGLIIGADCTIPATVGLDRINLIGYAAAAATPRPPS